MLMHKNQKGFGHHLILFVFVIVLIGLIGLKVAGANKHSGSSGGVHLFGTKPSNNQQSQQWWQNDAVTSKLSSCQGNSYLTSDVSTYSDLDRITPLGNIGPPSHIYPTDHIYMVPKSQMTSTPGQQPTVTTELLAPADVHVVGATSTDYYTNGQLVRSDWEYAYYPCQQLGFYNAHITQLAGGLEDTVAKTTKECLGDQKEGTNEYKTCNYHFDYMAKAGEQLGTTGGTTLVGAYDWGAFDLRVPKLKYVNQNMSSGGVGMIYNMVCPLDYFTPSLKTRYYGLLPDRPDPKCGTPMQDAAGSLQGNWRTADSKSNPPDWPQQLSVVHDNIDPSWGVIAEGGTVADAGSMMFVPTHSGTTNREPSEVKPDGKLYCYNRTDQKGMLDGKMLFQLTGPTSMKAENQSGSCGSNEEFTKPVIYIR